MLVELTYLCVINEWPVTVTSFVPSVHIVEIEYYVDTSHQICINMWGKGSSNIDWESRKEKLVHNSPTNAHEWIYYLSRQFNQLSNILMLIYVVGFIDSSKLLCTMVIATNLKKNHKKQLCWKKNYQKCNVSRQFISVNDIF